METELADGLPPRQRGPRPAGAGAGQPGGQRARSHAGRRAACACARAADAGGVRIQVEDTGPGLNEEQRTRLFTPYYTTKRGGTGLGLAIVQGIVSDHGGRVEVKSAPGKGTTFTLLPARRRLSEGSCRPVKPRILIVDDDQGTLASLSRAFALEGYTAITASSAARALERLDEEPVDAILSDVVMPEMDGLEFLAAVARAGAGGPGHPDERPGHVETAVKATRLGALDFVEKPVGLDRLLLTLRNALRLDRLQRENRELQRYWQDELALIGDSRGHAALRRADRAGGALRRAHPHPGRERHRQGAGGARRSTSSRRGAASPSSR